MPVFVTSSSAAHDRRALRLELAPGFAQSRCETSRTRYAGNSAVCPSSNNGICAEVAAAAVEVDVGVGVDVAGDAGEATSAAKAGSMPPVGMVAPAGATASLGSLLPVLPALNR